MAKGPEFGHTGAIVRGGRPSEPIPKGRIGTMLVGLDDGLDLHLTIYLKKYSTNYKPTI